MAVVRVSMMSSSQQHQFLGYPWVPCFQTHVDCDLALPRHANGLVTITHWTLCSVILVMDGTVKQKGVPSHSGPTKTVPYDFFPPASPSRSFMIFIDVFSLQCGPTNHKPPIWELFMPPDCGDDLGGSLWHCFTHMCAFKELPLSMLVYANKTIIFHGKKCWDSVQNRDQHSQDDPTDRSCLLLVLLLLITC